MLYAVIDIGSNTVKIAVLDEEKIFSSPPVFFKASPLNLKSKVENNRLSPQAVTELCDLMSEFAAISRRLTKIPPIAFATASLRGLENTEEILREIYKKSGVSVQVISGETEALYSFLGATGSVKARAGVSVDLGGGSTELLSFRKNRIEKAVSLPFGCITLYHRFFDGQYDYEGCCRLIREHLEQSAPRLNGNSIILSGGSAKAVLRYKNVLEDKKCFTVGTRQFRRIEHHWRRGDAAVREKMEAILKDRFRLIPPAVAVFSQIADFYGKDQLFISKSGVREGCLLNHLQKKL